MKLINIVRTVSHVQWVANDNSKTHLLLFLMLQSENHRKKIYLLFINSIDKNRAYKEKKDA